MMYALLKPKRMRAVSAALQMPFGCASVVLLIAGLYGAILAPHDEVQGVYAKILYVHVPFSWGALAVYTSMAAFSLMGLITRVPQLFLLTKAVAPIGMVYCAASLVTGSIWGKPTWGTFWVWDARLTSMFVLFLLYLGYAHLSATGSLKRLVPSAFLVVLGFVNIPIIKGSVEWWYTLHQPASIKMYERSSAIDWSMAWPLWAMALALVCYTVFLATHRVQHLIASMADFDQFDARLMEAS
jgi:heme exporter protein C